MLCAVLAGRMVVELCVMGWSRISTRAAAFWLWSLFSCTGKSSVVFSWNWWLMQNCNFFVNNGGCCLLNYVSDLRVW